jgi:hypothetical protein
MVALNASGESLNDSSVGQGIKTIQSHAQTKYTAVPDLLVIVVEHGQTATSRRTPFMERVLISSKFCFSPYL